MSTQQPPAGGQDGSPGYTPPQDPWSGFEPGLASVPTDPIPQQYATGPTVPAEVWAVPTGPQEGPPRFPYPPPKQGNNRAGVISVVVVLVLLLGGGGAYVAYRYLTTHGTPTGTPSASSQPATPAATDQFPYTVRVGDCVINVGTQAKPKMGPAACSTPGSFKVIKIDRGSRIPVGPSDKFDADTTSTQECAGTGYDAWYGYQLPDANDNLFFCLKNN